MTDLIDKNELIRCVHWEAMRYTSLLRPEIANAIGDIERRISAGEFDAKPEQCPCHVCKASTCGPWCYYWQMNMSETINNKPICPGSLEDKISRLVDRVEKRVTGIEERVEKLELKPKTYPHPQRHPRDFIGNPCPYYAEEVTHDHDL